MSVLIGIRSPVPDTLRCSVETISEVCILVTNELLRIFMSRVIAVRISLRGIIDAYVIRDGERIVPLLREFNIHQHRSGMTVCLITSEMCCDTSMALHNPEATEW